MITGLLFGSFNPIHVGHLIIANYMVEFTNVEEVWFVVSPHNPLKELDLLLDERQRLEMVKVSIGNDKRFKVSDVEFSLPKPSYTIDTLEYLKDHYPDREFILIMGSDGLETFQQWKDFQKLILGYKRYVYPRPGSLIDRVENGLIINAPMIDISSTFIRESIAKGKDMRFFVPLPAWELILIKELYQNL